MVRPKKETKDRKTEVVNFRMKVSEFQRLKKGAEEHGISISDYIRITLLGWPPIDAADEMRELLAKVNTMRTEYNGEDVVLSEEQAADFSQTLGRIGQILAGNEGK